MLGGISGWQLAILLLIVVLVFGTKRLRNIGGDLGSAVKGFKKGMEDGGDDDKDAASERLSADPDPASDSTTANREEDASTTRPPGSKA